MFLNRIRVTFRHTISRENMHESNLVFSRVGQTGRVIGSSCDWQPTNRPVSTPIQEVARVWEKSYNALLNLTLISGDTIWLSFMSSRKLSDTYIALRWKIDEPGAIFFPSETFYRYWNSFKDNIENTKHTYKMRFYPVKWKVNVKFNSKKKITFLLFF